MFHLNFWMHAVKRILEVVLGDKANSVVFDNSKLKRLVPDLLQPLDLIKGLGKL